MSCLEIMIRTISIKTAIKQYRYEKQQISTEGQS
uniref:Transposase n=1 Tax=Ascaris lumbricoides TaxID=6252 RepID=A0A0M3HIG6_ASCLU